jgi:hypothetical protein
MKKVISSLKVGKKPKKPKMNASSRTWDKFEVRAKAHVAKVKYIEKEKERRIKLKDMF